MDVYEIFREGCRILDEVMKPQDFSLVEAGSGLSSGGTFARGEYVRGDRRLEIHFRHSLGLVTYHMGSLSLTHDAYMRAMLGRGGGNQYPGFSFDPLDGFRHLRHDLSHFCGDFLSGSDEEFERLMLKAQEQEKVKGLRELPP
jgi:hypothetical protein